MGYVEEIEWHLRASRNVQEIEAKKRREEFERKRKAEYEALMKRLDEERKN